MSEHKNVIVIAFDEGIDFGEVMDSLNALSLQDKFTGLQAYAAMGNLSQLVIRLVSTDTDDEGMVGHAKRELALLANDKEFNDAIIFALKGFLSYGHSGGSASYAIPLLNDLLQNKNLSPLTDDSTEWMDVDGHDIWQSRRNAEAFSNDGGKTYYLLSEGGNDKNRGPLHASVRKM